MDKKYTWNIQKAKTHTFFVPSHHVFGPHAKNTWFNKIKDYIK